MQCAIHNNNNIIGDLQFNFSNFKKYKNLRAEEFIQNFLLDSLLVTHH